jgi:large subunit ribosomal protein LX
MAKEAQVNNFKITFQEKPLKNKKFYEVEIRAVEKEAAIEKAYSRIGSKHRIPRHLLKIKNVKKIDEDNLKSPILREIAKNDKIRIHND